jgi:hypothetical protein
MGLITKNDIVRAITEAIQTYHMAESTHAAEGASDFYENQIEKKANEFLDICPSLGSERVVYGEAN